ncbi:MAG: radical SAM protein, partial [Thermoplasmata archaeon]|nr:radical SAM protein [Thermoplasmata archaeon]
LKGYSEHSDFDSEMDDLKTSILASMLAIIDSDTNNLPSAVKSNLEDLVGDVKMTLKELPKNIQAFINSVFGTGGINYGRLDGTLVSSNQIIYHKRDESEFSINLTNRCPNSCIFCIRDFSAGWDRRTPNGDMINLYLDREPTLEEVIAAVEEELSNWDEDVSLIKLCGYGEPVLRMGLIVELAKRIRELSPNSSIQLNTSGWPLLVDYGEECLKNLRDAGIDILSISVNAPSKGVYDRIVRPGCFHYVRDAFEETLECIQLGVKNGFRVKATIVDIKPVRMYTEECRRLVEQMGAEFVVREFVGKELPGLSEEGFEVVEMETKILDIDREKIIGKLESLDATHRLTGITRLLHYDIPDDIDRRKGILELIERNIPEFRRFYSILDVIARCIRDGTNLYQRGGFLRIRNENDKEVAIIYKEPLGISNKVKKEREFYYLVESEEFAVSLLEQWQLELIRFIEKNRESYVLGGVMYDIDTWPSLGTYLEVEADDEILIFQGLSRIGISSSKAIGVHAEELFKEHRINPKRLVFTEEELRRLGTERSGSPIRD